MTASQRSRWRHVISKPRKSVLGIAAVLVVTMLSPLSGARAVSPVITSFADPGVQFQSTNLTSATMRTVTFDDTGTFGGNTVNSVSGTINLANIGTLSGTGTVYRNDYVWGGANGSGGFPQAGNLTFNLTNTQRYVGFWWSAGNSDNTVTLLDSNGAALGSFTTADLFTALDGSCGGAVQGIDPYCGNPNASADPTNASANEPFAYINIRFADGFQRVRFSGSGFEFDNVSFSQTVPARVSTETTVSLDAARSTCSGVTSAQANSTTYACPKTVSIARGESFNYSPLANTGISGYSYPANASVSAAYVFEGVGEVTQGGDSLTLSAADTGTYVIYYTVSIGGVTDTSTITVSVLDASGSMANSVPVDPRNTSVRLPAATITGSDEVVMCVHQVTTADGTTAVTVPEISVTSTRSVSGINVINSGSTWRSRGTRANSQTQLSALRVAASNAGNPAVSPDPVFLRVRFAPGVSAGSNQCLGGNTEILTLYPLTIAGVANGQNVPLG
jgi:hypothetical protein